MATPPRGPSALLILLWSGLAVAASDGGTPTFAEFLRRSETVLSGTVERAWVDMDRRVHAAVVRVALKGVRAVKGSRANRSLITLWPPGDDPAETQGGVPREFRKGERYIFVIPESLDEERLGYAPIMPWSAGVFPVVYDSTRRRSLVYDLERRPVARIDRDRLVVIDVAPGASSAASRRAHPPGGAILVGPRIEVLPVAMDPGTRVSEEDFLSIVREIRARRGGPG